jgi:Uma2 family endonuclease
MAREYAVQLEESLRIPAAARSFEGFRKWARSPAFPETGRIDFLAGDLEIDMSPEDLHTHGTVKVAIASTLHTLIADGDQGEVFVDRARVVSRFAALSVEPDAVVVLWDSLRSGRVRYVPSDPEIEGAPDVIIEVVSDGSVRKDTQRLPPLYARAGIPELWLVDTRKEPLRFDIHVLQDGRYVRVEPDAEGWSRSERLSRDFRLTRRKTPVGSWGSRLEWRTG